MNRIEQSFKALNEQNRKAFIPYIMAGDGGLNILPETLTTLEKFGATLIEVGVPFSDPVADGPTIQQAGIRSLQNGTTLRGIIAELTKARGVVSIPIVLMTYLNPIYSYGISTFAKDLAKAGVDGCIIPDLPIEEEDLLAAELENAGIELIRLVTLTSPRERIKEISSRGKGFLYTVTVKGITGTRNEFDQEVVEFLKRVKEVSPIPVVAGFGISTESQIKELTTHCDGVIVGSKIVDLLNKNDINGLESFMSVLKPEKNIR
ncbi:tryptophan synthase subunit alpha [Bacillus sp. EB106-08-02-XG196]|uniref:tryptophan synthase subunit alpha n=1 Tax=Bacillus sp. EB106-08-02-XG196 TaxID=2737049 RepID=UPI0015C439F3|nr:tryptophan synthase subunit alpha [Bacillus sp. EB106-08-02-XG196]NWQ42103.1 tryptophan synthase subunit alpha [Bacillus sp. EB106-08-02-XG196]